MFKIIYMIKPSLYNLHSYCTQRLFWK